MKYIENNIHTNIEHIYRTAIQICQTYKYDEHTYLVSIWIKLVKTYKYNGDTKKLKKENQKGSPHFKK